MNRHHRQHRKFVTKLEEVADFFSFLMSVINSLLLLLLTECEWLSAKLWQHQTTFAFRFNLLRILIFILFIKIKLLNENNKWKLIAKWLERQDWKIYTSISRLYQFRGTYTWSLLRFITSMKYADGFTHM